MDFIVAIVTALWITLNAMAPYLLFGFLIAGILSVIVSPEVVERHLGGHGIWPIIKASLFGVPLPLCSCGVIPVAASLRKHGASRPATTSFLLSTPQTGIDSILVTLSLLGPVFAIFRPIAAFLTGVFGGAVVALFGGARGASETDVEGANCTDACCSLEGGQGKLKRILQYGFLTLPEDIGKSILVGLAIAALLSVVVPEDFFVGALGTGFTGMLVMMLCGIPLYVCATASIPIAAILILEKGVSPGAALVFLMTGPTTNAASIATIWKVMGRRTALLYLGSVAFAALGSGALLDLVFRHPGIPSVSGMSKMLPGYVGMASAFALLVVIFGAMLRPRRRSADAAADGHEHGPPGERVVFEVGGMTCSHCVAAVKRALMECEGVGAVSLELSGGRAVVTGKGLDDECLTRAVEELGYTARRADASETVQGT